MRVYLEGRYQGLSAFDWNDIPEFAVLTGLNGSGKTQLLRAIQAEVQEHAPAPPRAPHPVLSPARLRRQEKILERERNKVHVEDFYAPKSAIPLIYRGQWDQGLHIGTQSMSDVQVRSNAMYQAYVSAKNNPSAVQATVARFPEYAVRIAEKLKKPTADLSFNDLVGNLYARELPPREVHQCNVAAICYSYRAKELEALTVGTTLTEFAKANGEAPWEQLKQLLSQFALPISFTDPSELPLSGLYECKMVLRSDPSINANYATLSSGEQVLLSIVMWLFNAFQLGLVPKLLLLDEPDAHLHPSLTKQMMNALREVLCEQHKTRIIMTTHSPSTVALCPEGSIFLITREPTQIKQIRRQDAIRQLTDNLVMVTPGLRVVLVEDVPDRDFYSLVFDEAVKQGRLSADPPLFFLPAGSDGKSAQTGGRTIVEKWTAKMKTAGLDHLMVGLVDRDSGGDPAPHVRTISRYSIENYLLDPIVVHVALNDVGRAPQIPGLALTRGEERSLLRLGTDRKQAIADSIHSDPSLLTAVAPTEDERQLVPVKIGGETMFYPRWLFDRPGKRLLGMYREAFGVTFGDRVLLGALGRVPAIPDELIATLNACQDQQLPLPAPVEEGGRGRHGC